MTDEGTRCHFLGTPPRHYLPIGSPWHSEVSPQCPHRRRALGPPSHSWGEKGGCTEDLSRRCIVYNITSIEACLWWVSLLLRYGASALQRRWLGDDASSNALSISLFAPMANPVVKRWCSRQARGHDSCPMMAILCQCSSGRMKPSYGKVNP